VLSGTLSALHCTASLQDEGCKRDFPFVGPPFASLWGLVSMQNRLVVSSDAWARTAHASRTEHRSCVSGSA